MSDDSKAKQDASQPEESKVDTGKAATAKSQPDEGKPAASKTATTKSQPAKKKAVTIQCLLRRKNGTQVTFGHNRTTQKTYHFKPINNSDYAPHVCDVDDQDHVAKLLSISEAYRYYHGDETGENDYIDGIEVTSDDPTDEKSFLNKFDDILSIDFETAENDTIADWAKETLELTPAHHAKIREKAARLGIEPKKGDSMNELLRKIGEAMQEEEREAIEQAEKDK